MCYQVCVLKQGCGWMCPVLFFHVHQYNSTAQFNRETLYQPMKSFSPLDRHRVGWHIYQPWHHGEAAPKPEKTRGIEGSLWKLKCYGDHGENIIFMYHSLSRQVDRGQLLPLDSCDIYFNCNTWGNSQKFDRSNLYPAWQLKNWTILSSASNYDHEASFHHKCCL